MILVISGTNRKASKTRFVSEHVYETLRAQGEDVKLLALDDLPWQEIVDVMYSADDHPASLREVDESLVIPANQWIIISPEYNGSAPGILKLFIDAVSMHRYPDTFQGKQVLLMGVAAGRAGNLRGMEDLTGFLNYLKMHVFPQKLPISVIGNMITEEGVLNDETQEAIQLHLKAFLSHVKVPV